MASQTLGSPLQLQDRTNGRAEHPDTQSFSPNNTNSNVAPSLVNRSPFVKQSQNESSTNRISSSLLSGEKEAKFKYSITTGVQTPASMSLLPPLHDSISRTRPQSPLANGTDKLSAASKLNTVSRTQRISSQSKSHRHDKATKPRSHKASTGTITVPKSTHSRHGSKEEMPTRATPARRAKLGVTYTEPSIGSKHESVPKVQRSRTTSEVPDTHNTADLPSTGSRRSRRPPK